MLLFLLYSHSNPRSTFHFWPISCSWPLIFINQKHHFFQLLMFLPSFLQFDSFNSNPLEYAPQFQRCRSNYQLWEPNKLGSNQRETFKTGTLFSLENPPRPAYAKEKNNNSVRQGKCSNSFPGCFLSSSSVKLTGQIYIPASSSIHSSTLAIICSSRNLFRKWLPWSSSRCCSSAWILLSRRQKTRCDPGRCCVWI